MPEPKRRRKKDSKTEEDERYKALEQELQFTRENLRSTVEELETSNEELNSTNEELESSREEMQSMNEELNTINNEYSKKIEEMSGISDDMKNLLNSTDIATIFLDEDLHIKWFTPPTATVLNLREGDVGRPVSDITARITLDSLAGDAQKVLDDLIPVETEVQAGDNHWYSMRILPYRTSDNAIDGVVISFIDISRQKELQEELKKALEYTNSILDTIREPMVVLNGDLKIESVNQAFYRTFNVDKKETEGILLYQLGNGQWDIPELKKLLGEILPKNTSFEDYEVEHDFPGIGKRRIILNARRLQLDEAQRILLAMEDITEHEHRK